MTAHNGSSFDSYVVLYNLRQWLSVGNLIKNGAGIVSPKLFKVYVKEKKKIPENVHFKCGRVHIISSLKKIGTSYKLQPSLIKRKTEHTEIYEETWKARENE